MKPFFHLLLPLSLCCALGAQGAIIVDASGGGDFTTIQPAVDASLPGGLIRVRYGVYPGPVLITKGLRIIGDPRDRQVLGGFVSFSGEFIVRGIPLGQAFIASDLFQKKISSGFMEFQNCQGGVHLSTMSAAMRFSNCAYVTDDYASVTSVSGANPVLILEDTVGVFSRCGRGAFRGPSPVVRMTRSKVTFVSCGTGGSVIPPLGPAVEVIDSEFIWDKSSRFSVGCDQFGNCPQLFIQSGSSTVERFAGAAMIAEQEFGGLKISLLGSSFPSTMVVTLASLPSRPIDLPNGTLYLDLPSSVFLFLDPPPPAGLVFTLPFPQLIEKLGVPITIQTGELVGSSLRLSLPSTIVL